MIDPETADERWAKVYFLQRRFEEGIQDVQPMPDLVHWAGVERWKFTHAVVYGRMNDQGAERWCYTSYAAASTALAAWVSGGCVGEPEGWHVHQPSGRQRPGGEP